jgi:transmembrane sensor
MDKQSFYSILDKYQAGTASTAEKALIEEYYRRLELAGTTELSAEEEAVLKETMFQQIAAHTNVAEAKLISLKRKNYNMVAAAAALLLVGAGGYFWFSQKPAAPLPPRTVVKTKSHDLPPGRDAATLTLADGKTIILDSANGAITQQGGATVINLKGQVSYANTTEKNNPAAVVYNTVNTARGNQYQLILADGSRVWLNSASSLRFPTSFTGNRREVELDGEGYFEVTKDAAKPFHVKTRNQDIEVLGTNFNVNAYNDEEATRTTLLEGKVKVSSTANGQWSMLKPGEQAVKKENSPFTIDYSPDLEQVMAWKNGWFEFDDTDIKVVMRQISRWYDVDIRFDTKTTNETYGGRISRKLNLSNILKMLESYGLHFKLEGKTLTVIQ